MSSNDAIEQGAPTLTPHRLQLPLSRDAAASLHAGDFCLLTGPLFTLRDAGHIRLLAELDQAASGEAAPGEGARGEQVPAGEASGDGASDQGHAQVAPAQPQAGAGERDGMPAGGASGEGERNGAPTGGELPYGLTGQTIFYAGPTPPAAGRPFGAVGPTTASRMDFAAPRLYDRGVAATLGKGKRSAAVHQACARNGAVYFLATGGAAAYLAKCVTSSQTVAYADLGTEALRRIEVVDFPVFVGIDAQGRDIYELRDGDAAAAASVAEQTE